MPCPLCGDECHCSGEQRRVRFHREKRSVHANGRQQERTFVIDPECSDTSEQQFAASLENSDAAERRPRFVISPPETENRRKTGNDAPVETGFRIMLASNGDDGSIWTPEKRADGGENRIIAVAEAAAPETESAAVATAEWQDPENEDSNWESGDEQLDGSSEGDWR